MKFIGIIPARYASTRFPAKPLAILGGKTVIERVYSQVEGVLDDVCVATDDERIMDAVKVFGGKAVMTSVNHMSGTDRVQEAFTKVGNGFDVIVNIQGDEPFIQAQQLEAIRQCFDDESVDIATLVKPIDDPAVATDPNKVKVVTDRDGKALYFSRLPIPYVRDANGPAPTYLQHLGIYAYRYKTLCELVRLTPSTLEQCEKLEQLRWLENGYSIHTASCHYNGIGIDTPADLEHVQNLLSKQNNDL